MENIKYSNLTFYGTRGCPCCEPIYKILEKIVGEENINVISFTEEETGKKN